MRRFREIGSVEPDQIGGYMPKNRAMWEFVHAEKLSHKKRRRLFRAGSTDVAFRRGLWTKYRERIEPSRLVFIVSASVSGHGSEFLISVSPRQ